MRLELQLSLELLKRYIAEHPDQAQDIAIILAHKYKHLEQDFEQMKSESIQSSKAKKSLELPWFINRNRN